MKYVYLLEDQTVQEVIPEYSELFPGIPVRERYSPEFLAHCITVADALEVESGMRYDPEQEVFLPAQEEQTPVVEEPEEGKTGNVVTAMLRRLLGQ